MPGRDSIPHPLTMTAVVTEAYHILEELDHIAQKGLIFSVGASDRNHKKNVFKKSCLCGIRTRTP